MVYVLAGVSGSGKTVVGTALADRLGLPFCDGDEFHPPGNVAKMSAGIPLDDADREPWLWTLAGKIGEWNATGRRRDGAAMAAQAGGAVLACSALKEKYRQILREGGAVTFVFLDVSKETLVRRLGDRKGHFMPAALLESQLETLQIPNDAVRVEGTGGVDAVVQRILAALDRQG